MLLERLESRYARRIRVFYPDAQAIERYVREHGINGFYNSLGERLSCCQMRKVEPFKRALAGYGAWVTGVRREQSEQRGRAEAVTQDEQYGLVKVSPLLDWSESEIWSLHPRARTALQHAARPRLSEHWLRTLHACRRARPGPPGRPLVVGAARLARMRAAPAQAPAGRELTIRGSVSAPRRWIGP